MLEDFPEQINIIKAITAFAPIVVYPMKDRHPINLAPLGPQVATLPQVLSTQSVMVQMFGTREITMVIP